MCTDFLRIIRVIFFERNNKILKRSIIEYIYNIYTYVYIQKKFGGRRNQYNYFPLFQITKIKVAVAKTLCEINKILSFAWKENYFINVK